MSNFLTELADMFPSWDAEALRAVHEANRGDQEKTITQLLAWTAEDAPGPQQPAAAFPVVCPPGAGPGTQLLVHAPTTGQQMTVVVSTGIGPNQQFLVALPPQQRERRRRTRQHDGPRIMRQEELFISLRQRERRDRVLQTELGQHRHCGRKLTLAAID